MEAVLNAGSAEHLAGKDGGKNQKNVKIREYGPQRPSTERRFRTGYIQ